MKRILTSLIILCSLILLQGCQLFKETGNSSNGNKIGTKKAKEVMLKNTNKSGVKSFTLSNLDSKSLSKDDTKQLNAVAREIKAMGKCQVTVIGHADNTGTSEVNESVSAKRAKLVADYLKQKGVSNITTSWESYNHPVAGNDTASGRAKNRRVEIFVSTVGKYNPYK